MLANRLIVAIILIPIGMTLIKIRRLATDTFHLPSAWISRLGILSPIYKNWICTRHHPGDYRCGHIDHISSVSRI